MKVRKVKELQSEEYVLVTDSQEINYILDYIGCDLGYSCLLVKIDNGDYAEVWGCDYPPYLDCLAERVL